MLIGTGRKKNNIVGHTEPHEKIHAKGPTASLVSKRVLSSLFGHVFLQGFFQWLVYTLVRKQPWYTPPVIDPDEKNISCYENTSLFLFSCFQYVLIAVIFSVGPPYRKKMTSNGKLKINRKV
jgi:cation-transporting P-type ATPase 13A2